MGGWRVLVVAMLLVAGVAGSASPGVAQDDTSGDVPMFRGNAARTGEMPGPGPEGEISVLWQWTGDEGVFTYIRSSPAVVDGVVYVGAGYARENVATNAAETYTYGGYVLALDAATGEEQWRFPTGHEVFSSPAVVDGVVYAGSRDGNLYALDAATGGERWRYAAGDDVYTSPAVFDGVVYFGGEDGNVYAIDAATGRERWSAGLTDRPSSLAVSDGMVYVNSNDGHVTAIESDTGNISWSVLFSDDFETSPAVRDGLVYVRTSDGFLHALDAGSGRVEWRSSVGGWVLASPAVTTDLVVVGASGHGENPTSSTAIAGIDTRDGSETWRVSLSGETVYSSPVIADNVVYVGSYVEGADETDTSGQVYAIDASTGQVLWRFEAEAGIWSSPAVVDGMVIVGDFSGKVYALAGDPAQREQAAATNKYIDDIGFNLAWLAENSSDVPRGLDIGEGAGAGDVPWLPWNAAVGRTWPVALQRDDPGGTAVSVLLYDDPAVASSETQGAIDGLMRRGWAAAETDRVAAGDTCLTYRDASGAQAVCYAVRGRLVIVGVSALPVDNVDAVLMNAADLVRLGVAATQDLALPE